MTDEFTTQHMAGGNVVHRDKRVARGLTKALVALTAIFGVGGLGGLVGVLAGVGPPGGLAAVVGLGLAAMFGFMTLTGTVLRTVVTDRELHVSGGLAGTRIPLGRIVSLRIGEQRNRIRSGKRREGGMWTTSFLVALGEYVEVVWKDDEGKDKRLLFTPQDPHAVLAAVERARGGVRVEVEGAAPVAVEQEVEVEVPAGPTRES